MLVKPTSFKSIFVRFGTFSMQGRKRKPNSAGTKYPFGAKISGERLQDLWSSGLNGKPEVGVSLFLYLVL